MNDCTRPKSRAVMGRDLAENNIVDCTVVFTIFHEALSLRKFLCPLSAPYF